MITLTILNLWYELSVAYKSATEIEVIFVKESLETEEEEFTYQFSHYLDAVGKILEFNSYFEKEEYDRFYHTVIELFK